MNVTIKPIHLWIFAAILLLGIAGAAAYVASAISVAKAEQVREDMKPIHQEAQQEKQSAQQQKQVAVSTEETNQKALLATLAAIAAQKQQPIATPVDYARIEQMIEERMGTKAVVKPDPSLPNAPSATMDAKSLTNYMLDCDAKSAKLNACYQSVQNIGDQLAASDKELAAEVKDHKATKTELDATRTAMKGGSFWKRFKSNGKWMIIGAGAGAVAASMARR